MRLGASSPKPARMAAWDYLWSFVGARLMGDVYTRQTPTRPSSPFQGRTACPNQGTGLEKVAYKKLTHSFYLMEATALPEAFYLAVRTIQT